MLNTVPRCALRLSARQVITDLSDEVIDCGRPHANHLSRRIWIRELVLMTLMDTIYALPDA